MRLSMILAVFLAIILMMPTKAQDDKNKEKCTGDCCANIDHANKKDTFLIKNTSMESPAKPKALACKLTSPELQKRKAEVLASLKRKILKKEELLGGYKYTFDGSDANLDELTTFIKTERACCDFFDFTLVVSDRLILLSITGPKGAKEFISDEMDL